MNKIHQRTTKLSDAAGGNGEPHQLLLEEQTWLEDDVQNSERWVRLRDTFAKDSSLKLHKNVQDTKTNCEATMSSSSVLQSLCFSCTDRCIASPPLDEIFDEDEEEFMNDEDAEGTSKEVIETEDDKMAENDKHLKGELLIIDGDGKKSMFSSTALKIVISLTIWALGSGLYLAYNDPDGLERLHDFVSHLRATVLGEKSYERNPSLLTYLFSCTEIPHVKAWCYISKYADLPNYLINMFGA